MAVIRWRPGNYPAEYWREVQDLFNRFLHEGQAPVQEVEFHPPMSILETERDFIVELEIPGIDAKHAEVSMQGDTLIVRGEKKFEEVPDQRLHAQERYYGKFHRYIEIPYDIAAEKISADYKNGVLRVVLPKAPEAKKKEVEIKVS
jgi:HSP20 family protein